ncbi:pseudouridine synthase [Opacimonas viscosa]|nr:pseudouridine synthase [Opacimonas viscosa]
MQYDILYDHCDFVIIHKPRGVTMHQSSQSVCPALLDHELAQQYFIVHRLDDQTSGCLILAKSAEAAERFRVLFSSHTIQKTYIALSDQKGKRKMGWVKGDMANIRSGIWGLKNTQTNPAVSYFIRQGLGNGRYLFWVRPFSGKTHQIRVALKSNGSPILGDTVYKGTSADRLYLHAFALEFDYDGTNIHVSASPNSGTDFHALATATEFLHSDNVSSLAWPAV